MTADIDYLGYIVATAVSLAMTTAIAAFSIEIMHNIFYIGDWTIAPIARVMVVPIGIIGFVVVMITPALFRRARERLHLIPCFCWWMAVQSALLGGLMAGRVRLLARIAGGEEDQILALLGEDTHWIAAGFAAAAIVFVTVAIVSRRRLAARGL